jgi:putative SOS response-associated peptidase YedK
MCYWVGSRKVREVMLKKLEKNPQDEIAQLFYNTFIEPPKLENKQQLMEYPVAIGKAKPILTALLKTNEGLAFENLTWTLNWNYWDTKLKVEKKGMPLLISRCENVFWQHNDLIFTKRCIIPVDGYWEFYHFNGSTYPYFIYPANGELFYLGGIYNEYADAKTGDITSGFSIISTPPNEVTAKLHNNPKAPNGARMLLILGYEDAISYLDANLNKYEIENNFFKVYEASKMKIHPTLSFLKKENLAFIASEKVQEPFVYPELVLL